MVRSKFLVTCEFPVDRYLKVIASLSAGDIPTLNELQYCRCTKKGPTCLYMYTLYTHISTGMSWCVYSYITAYIMYIIHPSERSISMYMYVCIGLSIQLRSTCGLELASEEELECAYLKE